MNKEDKNKVKVALFTAYCLGGLAMVYWASRHPENVRQVHIKLAAFTQRAALNGSDAFRIVADKAGTYAARLKVNA